MRNADNPNAPATDGTSKGGRPVTVEDHAVVTVRIPRSIIERVDKRAARWKVTRSDAIRRLIERGLKEKR